MPGASSWGLLVTLNGVAMVAQIIKFEEIRRLLQNMPKRDDELDVELDLPEEFMIKTHFFYFPRGGGNWFSVREMETGDWARYMDAINSKYSIVRDDQGTTEQRSYPPGLVEWTRFEIFVTNWSVRDKKSKLALITKKVWERLPREWTNYVDLKIQVVNPDLFDPENPRDKTLPVPEETEDPTLPKASQPSPSPAKSTPTTTPS